MSISKIPHEVTRGTINAILSGLLTLAGVILTILHLNSIRNKDEKIYYKPIFCLLTNKIKNPNYDIKNIDIYDLKNDGKNQTKIIFKNLNKASLVFKRLEINKKEIKIEDDIIIEQNKEFVVKFAYDENLNFDNSKIFIIVADILGNEYYSQIIYKHEIPIRLIERG